MKYINFEYYRVFYYVAKYKSLTQAANILNNSQPNISRTIHRLEEDLGCKLFIRTNRGVTMTPEGESLYTHIGVAIEQIQAGENEVSQLNNLGQGYISIGCTETALNLFLLKKLQYFHQRFPQIRLHITNHSSIEAIKALENGSVDCAIVSSPIDISRGLKTKVLQSFQEILVGSEEYKELSIEYHSIKELLDLPFIMLNKGTATWNLYNQWFLKHDLSMKTDIEVATADQILPLVLHNLGLGFVAKPLIEKELKEKKLYQILLEEQLPQRELILVEDPKRPASMALKEFITVLYSS